jgi:hypothetical protein
MIKPIYQYFLLAIGIFFLIGFPTFFSGCGTNIPNTCFAFTETTGTVYEYKMNLIIQNYPIEILQPLLIPLKNKIKYSNLENKNKIYSIINNDVNLYNILKEDIYADKTILEQMENLRKIDKKSVQYDKLYQDIISVGEFNIEKN